MICYVLVMEIANVVFVNVTLIGKERTVDVQNLLINAFGHTTKVI